MSPIRFVMRFNSWSNAISGDLTLAQMHPQTSAERAQSLKQFRALKVNQIKCVAFTGVYMITEHRD